MLSVAAAWIQCCSASEQAVSCCLCDDPGYFYSAVQKRVYINEEVCVQIGRIRLFFNGSVFMLLGFRGSFLGWK